VKGLAGLGAVRASGIKDFLQMCEQGVALPIRTSSGVRAHRSKILSKDPARPGCCNRLDRESPGEQAGHRKPIPSGWEASRFIVEFALTAASRSDAAAGGRTWSGAGACWRSSGLPGLDA